MDVTAAYDEHPICASVGSSLLYECTTSKVIIEQSREEQYLLKKI